MAVKARSFNVLADQWVVRCIVIKLGLQPFCRLMTGGAFEAHGAVVRFVFAVTVYARGRRLTVFLVGFVAV